MGRGHECGAGRFADHAGGAKSGKPTGARYFRFGGSGNGIRSGGGGKRFARSECSSFGGRATTRGTAGWNDAAEQGFRAGNSPSGEYPSKNGAVSFERRRFGRNTFPTDSFSADGAAKRAHAGRDAVHD